MALIFIYLICFFFRIVEYFVFRTDQSIFGEAFFHKIIGILVLIISIKYFNYQWKEIGFKKSTIIKDTSIGLLFGIIVFMIAYSIEVFIQNRNSNNPIVQLFVTSYSIDGNTLMENALLFCIIGNIINVIMEEGIFRGLFLFGFEKKYSFIKSCLISSSLFGLWHIVAPLRSLYDGNQTIFGVLFFSLLLIITSALFGIQLCLLLKISGSIWASMAVHFVNNMCINLIHIKTLTGIDEFQIVRITIAQTFLFISTLVIYIIKNKKSIKSSHNFV